MRSFILFLFFSFTMNLAMASNELPLDNNDPVFEELDGIHFNIKPTLASDDITIHFDESQRLIKVEILDLTGRSVFKDTYFDRDRIEINVSEYKRSPYFVRVTIENKIKTKRFVKN